jgi:hypothetical protein
MCKRSLVHPNVVLVMGLSHVRDPCSAVDGTLCIITEFLER